jgi:hypothetical protein
VKRVRFRALAKPHAAAISIYMRYAMRRGSRSYGAWFAVLATVFVPSRVHAEDKPEGGSDDSASVGAKLQNPIADIVSVPVQNNFNFGIGPQNKAGYILNIQPVVPIPLGTRWKVISRSILPVMDQPDTSSGGVHKFGLGDWTQSFFFSPVSDDGFTWGIGPAFLIPTATSESLGSGKWGVGPTAVALYAHSGITLGILTNQIWSFAGGKSRSTVSSTLLQPFAAYTFKIALTINLQTETSYDWIANQWTVPLQFGLSQVIQFGKLPVSIGVLGRVWLTGPASAPEWGIRVPITFVLPAIGS